MRWSFTTSTILTHTQGGRGEILYKNAAHGGENEHGVSETDEFFFVVVV